MNHYLKGKIIDFEFPDKRIKAYLIFHNFTIRKDNNEGISKQGTD
jgi:hypothetical protein